MNVSIDPHPDPNDVVFLKEKINRFNIETTGIRDVGLLCAIVRDEAGKIGAGIFGWTWGGCAEIKTLWVAETHRRQGFGRRLLEAAEAEAMARGCHQIVLDTHSFQAPGFYRKLGYEEIGRREHYLIGHQKTYFRNDLVPIFG